MALNGNQWEGPPETQEYMRQLERIIAELQQQVSTLISQTKQLSKR